MKQFILVFLFAVLQTFNVIHAQTDEKQFPELSGAYLGQIPPGKTAEIFAPGIISTELHDDSSPAFSPDGKEVFFRIVFKKHGQYYSKIFHTKENEGKWMVPTEAKFCETADKQFHGVISFSPDGNRLYNSMSDLIDGKFNLDMAVIYKKNNQWISVSNISSLNSDFNDSYYFETPDGKFYWSSEKMRNDPEPDFYSADYSENGFTSKKKVSGFPESAIVTYISPQNDFALLTWKEQESSYDIYISFKLSNGSWGQPVNMGPAVNSNYMEKHAVVSHDNKYIFFVSGRTGNNTQPEKLWNSPHFSDLENVFRADIYWVDAGIINDLKKIGKE